jgi:ubiquinone/menaquinone biosynthesis C-methylase UbiE
MLYNPLRKWFTDRQAVLDECHIAPGTVVLEIGAGNGFFTEAIAERAGKVIAVELQQGMVRKLRRRTQRFGAKVEIVSGDIAGVGLGEAIADVCLLYYSFHEISRQAEAAAAICRSLKPGGTLAIYEPALEVSEKAMRTTLEHFIRRCFTLEKTAQTIFTRHARLFKKTDMRP